jgi:hypothetical protein
MTPYLWSDLNGIMDTGNRSMQIEIKAKGTKVKSGARE